MTFTGFEMPRSSMEAKIKKRDGTMVTENNDEAIIRNLMDAGCDEDTITAFVENLHEEKIAEGLRLLATHRR